MNILQNAFKFTDLSPLSGFVENTDSVELNLHDWLNGTTQSKVDQKIKNYFGFSNIYIRINNQIAYSLFHKAKARDVVIGEENYMYEQNYINAYYGTDFIGEDSILRTVLKLKVIKDSLEKMNKHLLLVFCPGKASFYPEYIPKDQRKKETTRTNMRTYIKYARQENIDALNIYDMFLQQKNTSKHILYPKYGLHWSEYGEYLVFQELRNALKTKFNFNQYDIRLLRIDRHTWTEGRDMDIIDGLNLFFKPKNDTMSYPQLIVLKNSKPLPNAVVISDSFYWGIFGKGWNHSLFNKSEFWYYNTQRYALSQSEFGSCKDVDMKQAIANTDVFIIMATEATISRFGWNVIDKLYNELTHKADSLTPKYYSERIEYWKKFIRSNSIWLKDAEKRAKQLGLSLDSVILLDARYQTQLGN